MKLGWNNATTPGQPIIEYDDTIRQAIDLFRHNDPDGNAGVTTGLARQTGPGEYQKNEIRTKQRTLETNGYRFSSFEVRWGSGPRADFLGKSAYKN